MKHWKIQLHDRHSGELISDTGGVAFVAKAGLLNKEALLDSTGASASNPSVLTNGLMDFYTANSVVSVDLYIMAPKGQFVVKRTVKASGPNEIFIDLSDKKQVAVIPFDRADYTDNVEFDTGFDLPTNAAVQHDGIGVHMVTKDDGETIDVGLLASESGGDANGFIATLSVGSAGFWPAKQTTATDTGQRWFSANTLGVLLSDFLAGASGSGASELNSGVFNPFPHVGDGTAKSISYTLTTGATEAAGYLMIPYTLPAV